MIWNQLAEKTKNTHMNDLKLDKFGEWVNFVGQEKKRDNYTV